MLQRHVAFSGHNGISKSGRVCSIFSKVADFMPDCDVSFRLPSWRCSALTDIGTMRAP